MDATDGPMNHELDSAAVGRRTQLRDGTAVTVRPIQPDDAAALVRFHEGLSLETTRLRFFTSHRHLSAAEVARFTTVDHRDREALVLVSDDTILAVGRYDRRVGTTEAEVAFVVDDAWRGQGGATILLSSLARQARRWGISCFVAETLAENRQMLDVFEHTGLVTDSRMEFGVIYLRMDLDGGGDLFN